MFKAIGAVLRYLVLVEMPAIQVPQFAGYPVDRSHWFRKKGVLWFNGFPGVPKLPLVQRRPRPAASGSLNPVAPFTPEDQEDMELEETESLCCDNDLVLI